MVQSYLSLLLAIEELASYSALTCVPPAGKYGFVIQESDFGATFGSLSPLQFA